MIVVLHFFVYLHVFCIINVQDISYRQHHARGLLVEVFLSGAKENQADLN